MNWFYYFFDFNIFSSLIPLIFGFRNFGKFSNQIRIVFYYVLANFTLTIASYLPVKSWFNLDSNFFILYIMAVINIAFKWRIFDTLISKKYPRLLTYLAMLGLSLVILILYYFGYNQKSTNYAVVVEACFSFLVSFWYLSNLDKNIRTESLRSAPFFWISLAFLFSAIFNYLLYSFGYDLYIYNPELFKVIQVFLAPFNETLINILITIAFYFSIRTK